MREEHDDELPWEKRGAMRLDAEPHRGKIVRYLGGASLIMGVLSFCTGFTGLVGVPLGMAALLMAHRDLAKMRAGVMDRRGEKRTRQGGDFGLIGLILSLFGIGIFTLFFLDGVLPPPLNRLGP